MAYKHIKAYYDRLCNEYMELRNEIKEFEVEASKDLVDPDLLNNLKDMLQPLMDNYERWSYMMYLWGLPVNKKKHESYNKQMFKKLSKLNSKNSLEATSKENQEVINNLKNVRKSI